MKPASFRRYRTYNASGSISRRDSECSERGMTVGSTMARGLYQMPGCQHTQVHALQRVSAAIALASLLVVASALPAHAQGDLESARQLYNSGQYDQAISVATRLKTTQAADGANLILGRSHLELFRKSADQAELVAAREALQDVRPAPLTGRDRIDYIVGLGECLYLEESFGAAVELFQAALAKAQELGPRAGERVFDWWATALDRRAQSGATDDRDADYASIRDRARSELGRMPGSIAAAYWLAVSNHYLGDSTKAWDAAVAGWILAPFDQDGGRTLRADLDQLVLQAIIPERLRQAAPTDRERVGASLRAAWDGVKKDWPTK
jgi:tetratricopeptide (TPR) repeat protein